MKTISVTLAGLILLSGCQPKRLEPWVVICDKSGHYTFTEEDGRPWGLQEWATYSEADDYRGRIKAIAEELQAYHVKNGREAERIHSKKWEACKP